MAKTTEKENLNESLKELAEMVMWFEDQKNIDVEEGLQKVRRGAELIKACKVRLGEIENEFKEIQKEMDTDLDDPAQSAEIASPGKEITYPDDEINPEEIPF